MAWQPLSQAPPPHGMPPPPPPSHEWGESQGGRGRIPTTQGTTGPLPLRLPLPLLFDTQTIMMAMMLCTMTLTCYSQSGCWWYLFSYVALGFGTACSLLYLVENRAWLVMFLRKLYRPFVTPSRVSVGFAFMYA